VLLREAGGYADTPKGWAGYLNYLSVLLEDPLSKKELISAKLSRGWCLGGAEFKQSMRIGSDRTAKGKGISVGRKAARPGAGHCGLARETSAQVVGPKQGITCGVHEALHIGAERLVGESSQDGENGNTSMLDI
jgi:hypothetical protein